MLQLSLKSAIEEGAIFFPKSNSDAITCKQIVIKSILTAYSIFAYIQISKTIEI